MGLAEAVACVADDVAEDGLRHPPLHPLVDGLLDEGLANGLHVGDPAGVGHHPAQLVGLARGEAGDGGGNLDHLLLKEDDAVGLGQDGLQLGVQVGDGRQPLTAGDKGLDHVALDRAGADQGDAGDDVFKAVGAQAGLQRPLRRALELEDADGLAAVQQLVDLGVGGL